MLSIKTLGVGTDHAYYTNSTEYRYYAQQCTDTKMICWQGRLAKDWGLTGFVHAEDFDRLLQGRLPGGKRMGRATQKGLRHRAGYDLTFTVPKSLSILMAFSDLKTQEKLQAAFDAAVFETLDEIEANYACLRLCSGGVTQFQQTGRLAIATFLEKSSRDLDPNFHRHCVVMNLTTDDQGTVKALGSDLHRRKGFQERLFQYRSVQGLCFRARLAEGVRALGFKINVTCRKRGFWELAGVPQDLITAYSSRRQAIVGKLKEWGVWDAQSASKAALVTRPPKKSGPFDRTHLDQHPNFKLEAFIKAHLDNRVQPLSATQKQALAEQVLSEAVHHCAEQSTVFCKEDLLARALILSLETLTPSDLALPLEEALCALLPLSEGVTTFEKFYLEHDFISAIARGKGAVSPLARACDLQEFMAQSKEKCTADQKRALIFLGTQRDRICAIQGSPGVGKTTLLRQFLKGVCAKRHKVLMIAPTDSACRQIQLDTGQEALTPHAGLRALKNDSIHRFKGAICLVDEASMLDPVHLNELARQVEKAQARLMLIGDRAQLPPVMGGDLFRMSQRINLKACEMKTLVRQKKPHLKAFVSALIENKLHAAFDLPIELIEIASSRAQYRALAARYCALSREERAHTLVIVPTHAARAAIHRSIRAGLLKTRCLTGPKLKHRRYESVSLTSIARTSVKNYQVGWTLRFNRTDKQRGIFSGHYYTVTVIQGERLLLTDHKAQKLYWAPSTLKGRGAIEIYCDKAMSLYTGEQLIWRRSDKSQGILNSEGATVVAIAPNKKWVTLQLSSGKSIRLHHSDPRLRHIDYGYTVTHYSAQSKTTHSVIAHLNTADFLNRRQALVTLSRMTDQVTIVTQDKAALIESLMRASGDKATVLEQLSLEAYLRHVPKDERLSEIIHFVQNNPLPQKFLRRFKKQYTYSPKLGKQLKGLVAKLRSDLILGTQPQKDNAGARDDFLKGVVRRFQSQILDFKSAALALKRAGRSKGRPFKGAVLGNDLRKNRGRPWVEKNYWPEHAGTPLAGSAARAKKLGQKLKIIELSRGAIVQSAPLNDREKKNFPQENNKAIKMKDAPEKTMADILAALKQKIQIKQKSKKYAAIAKDDRVATQPSNNPVARQIQAVNCHELKRSCSKIPEQSQEQDWER